MMLWGDLVIVRTVLQFTGIPVQSLGPMPTLSILPAALRLGIRAYRWLLKYPYKPTTTVHSVLEPKEMKQRKKKRLFFLTVSRQFTHSSLNSREQLLIVQSAGSEGFKYHKDFRRVLEPENDAPTREDILERSTQQITQRGLQTDFKRTPSPLRWRYISSNSGPTFELSGIKTQS